MKLSEILSRSYLYPGMKLYDALMCWLESLTEKERRNTYVQDILGRLKEGESKYVISLDVAYGQKYERLRRQARLGMTS